MKKLIALFIGMASFFAANAQDDSIVIPRVHEFGIHAGSTTGVGLSYRYWPQKLGIQVTLLPIKTDDLTFMSIGASALYSFYESRRIRFFGYMGNHLFYIRERYYDYSYSGGYDYTDNRRTRNDTQYNIGFGPGFSFGTRVRFNIMAGYGFYDIFGKFNIYPAGEVGLYFRM